jgi:hypothetical protein
MAKPSWLTTAKTAWNAPMKNTGRIGGQSLKFLKWIKSRYQQKKIQEMLHRTTAAFFYIINWPAENGD